jgi:hypothetical protein
MKYMMVLVCAVLFANAAIGEKLAGNLAQEFKMLPIEQRVMANLPKGREEDVINALIERGSISTLLRINHVPTVERVINSYLEMEGKSWPLRGQIGDSGSPYLVEKLAPALYKGDEMILRGLGEGGSDFGQSAAAALLVGQLLMKSPEFPAEVKEWAHRNLQTNSAACIAIARQFWELNEEALKAQKFDQVIAPEGPPSFPPLPRPEASQDPVTAPVPPTKQPLPPAVDPTPSQAVVSSRYWWIVGFVIAGIFCLVMIKKYK